jgi:serine/threonine protein kinase
MTKPHALPITLVRRLHEDDDAVWLVTQERHPDAPREMRARRFDGGDFDHQADRDELKHSVEFAQNIQHDNVVRILGYSESNGDMYVLTEQVDGLSLSELLNRMLSSGQTMDPRLSVWMIREVVRVLNDLQMQTENSGTTFRLDFGLSLNRILATRLGQVKISDMGRGQDAAHEDDVAVVLNMLATLGTASQESIQVNGRPIKSTDVFSKLISTHYPTLKTLETALERVFYRVYDADDERDGSKLLRELIVKLDGDTDQTEQGDALDFQNVGAFKGEFTRALESRYEPVVPQALTFADRVTGLDTITSDQQAETSAGASTSPALQRTQTIDAESIHEPRFMAMPHAQTPAHAPSRIVWFTIGFVSAIVTMTVYLTLIS